MVIALVACNGDADDSGEETGSVATSEGTGGTSGTTSMGQEMSSSGSSTDEGTTEPTGDGLAETGDGPDDVGSEGPDLEDMPCLEECGGSELCVETRPCEPRCGELAFPNVAEVYAMNCNDISTCWLPEACEETCEVNDGVAMCTPFAGTTTG